MEENNGTVKIWHCQKCGIEYFWENERNQSWYKDDDGITKERKAFNLHQLNGCPNPFPDISVVTGKYKKAFIRVLSRLINEIRCNEAEIERASKERRTNHIIKLEEFGRGLYVAKELLTIAIHDLNLDVFNANED